MASVTKTTEVPLFADANWIDIFPHHNDAPAADPNLGDFANSTKHMGRAYLYRHPSNTSNLFFVDGHGETVGIDSLWSFQWSKTFVPRDAP